MTVLSHRETRPKSSGWQCIPYGTRSILNVTLCLFGLFLADSVKGVWGLWSRNIWIMQQGLALWTLSHQTPKGSISKSCENILLNSKSLSVWFSLTKYEECLSVTWWFNLYYLCNELGVKWRVNKWVIAYQCYNLQRLLCCSDKYFTYLKAFTVVIIWVIVRCKANMQMAQPDLGQWDDNSLY